VWKIDRLFDNPGRLVAMRANARRLAWLPATSDIAALVDTLYPLSSHRPGVSAREVLFEFTVEQPDPEVNSRQ
jgi:hypothetical protein